MLKALELRDFAIVAELTLEFEPGLNVLSGETGTGKSILVDALALLAGGRPDARQIRGGADSALVQAEFTGADLAFASRRLADNGRHTARIDGELVTVAELTERAGALLAVYAQGSALELQSPQQQRHRLDNLLTPEHSHLLARHAAAFVGLERVTAELEALRDREREAALRRDSLTFQLAEIDAVKPVPGEDLALVTELEELEHAERIAHSAGAALAALSDGEPGALTLVADAVRELTAAARHSPTLRPLADDLKEALNGLGAIATELEGFLAGFDADPGRLDAVQSRLAKLEGLKRKYGGDVAGVVAHRERVAAEVSASASIEEDIARLAVEAAGLGTLTDELSSQLSQARREAARRLEADMPQLLSELGLPGARFEVALTPARRPGPAGRDHVTFMFSANPGEGLAPLTEVASGGEMSRLMLALHLVTGADQPTLVFDEVDAGIGGATANAVGRLLARLGRHHQVLVVTHLAQVAAFADAHFTVGKSDLAGRTIATVERLAEHRRPAELARMLSGIATDASIEHAGELLESARKTLGG